MKIEAASAQPLIDALCHVDRHTPGNRILRAHDLIVLVAWATGGLPRDHRPLSLGTPSTQQAPRCHSQCSSLSGHAATRIEKTRDLRVLRLRDPGS